MHADERRKVHGAHACAKALNDDGDLSLSMKEIKRKFLLRGRRANLRAYSEELGDILESADEQLAENQIASLQMCRDVDGTVVYFLVVQEFESDEEKRQLMDKLAKAKKT